MTTANWSKKLGAFVVSVVILMVAAKIGLDDETRAKVVDLTMTYLVGQSGVDMVLAFKGAKKG